MKQSEPREKKTFELSRNNWKYHNSQSLSNTSKFAFLCSEWQPEGCSCTSTHSQALWFSISSHWRNLFAWISNRSTSQQRHLSHRINSRAFCSMRSQMWVICLNLSQTWNPKLKEGKKIERNANRNLVICKRFTICLHLSFIFLYFFRFREQTSHENCFSSLVFCSVANTNNCWSSMIGIGRKIEFHALEQWINFNDTKNGVWITWKQETGENERRKGKKNVSTDDSFLILLVVTSLRLKFMTMRSFSMPASPSLGDSLNLWRSFKPLAFPIIEPWSVMNLEKLFSMPIRGKFWKWCQVVWQVLESFSWVTIRNVALTWLKYANKHLRCRFEVDSW